MFSKFQLLGLASLMAAPLAVNADCTFNFFSTSDCSGGSVGYCDWDNTPDYLPYACYWNTWVGSVQWSCDTEDSPSFVGCYGQTYFGDTEECADAWSIAVPATDNGCQVIGTYDGIIQVYDNNDPTCADCIGGDP